jgi:hypothetical protein
MRFGAKQLLLEQNDLLTVLLVRLIDKKVGRGIILAVGDGLIVLNGAVTEFDQGNKPDYLGLLPAGGRDAEKLAKLPYKQMANFGRR